MECSRKEYRDVTRCECLSVLLLVQADYPDSKPAQRKTFLTAALFADHAQRHRWQPQLAGRWSIIGCAVMHRQRAI